MGSRPPDSAPTLTDSTGKLGKSSESGISPLAQVYPRPFHQQIKASPSAVDTISGRVISTARTE